MKFVLITNENVSGNMNDDSDTDNVISIYLPYVIHIQLKKLKNLISHKGM